MYSTKSIFTQFGRGILLCAAMLRYILEVNGAFFFLFINLFLNQDKAEPPPEGRLSDATDG